MIVIIIITLPHAVILWCNSIYLMVSFSCMLARKLVKFLDIYNLISSVNPSPIRPMWAPEFGRYQEIKYEHVSCTCNFKQWAAIAHHLKSLVRWWACAVPPPHGFHYLVLMFPHCLALSFWLLKLILCVCVTLLLVPLSGKLLQVYVKSVIRDN